MPCSACGHPLTEEMRFCPACGAAAPAAPVVFAAPPPRRRGIPAPAVIAISLIFVLLGTAFGAIFLGEVFSPRENGDALVRISSRFFDTPEEAAAFYLEALSEESLEKAFTALDINEAAERFNLTTYVDQRQFFSAAYDMAPTEYERYVELNRAHRLEHFTSQLTMFYLSLSLSAEGDAYDDLIQGFPRAIPTGEDSHTIAKSYVRAADPSIAAGLSVKRIDIPARHVMDSDASKAWSNIDATIYDALETTERVALLSADDRLFWTGFQLIRYEEGWKISSLYAPTASQNIYGAAAPTTEEDYLGLLD